MDNFDQKQVQPDKEWTLFLDRDGVINVEKVGFYVTEWNEFRFCDGVISSVAKLSEIFGRIIVVSNQRGVGKGVMTMETLKDISTNMRTAIEAKGGKLDRIYVCTAVDDEDANRKPNTGMALQAKEDFPEIDFKKSIMVGNALSDMEFGKRVAMHTVFLTTKHEKFSQPHYLIDEQYESLQAWTETLVQEPSLL